jgi:hypothetical protein
VSDSEVGTAGRIGRVGRLRLQSGQPGAGPDSPAKTLEISLGGVTVLLTGGAGCQRSRRRKAGKAA